MMISPHLVSIPVIQGHSGKIGLLQKYRTEVFPSRVRLLLLDGAITVPTRVMRGSATQDNNRLTTLSGKRRWRPLLTATPIRWDGNLAAGRMMAQTTE